MRKLISSLLYQGANFLLLIDYCFVSNDEARDHNAQVMASIEHYQTYDRRGH